jgi:hypothetical protein
MPTSRCKECGKEYEYIAGTYLPELCFSCAVRKMRKGEG